MQSLVNFNSPDEVEKYLPLITSTEFDVEVYRAAGIFVVKGLFPAALVKGWQKAWDDFSQEKLKNREVGFNKVHVGEALPETLDSLYQNEYHIKVARSIFGEDIGLYVHRFVIKDQFSRDKVFLHNDACYHAGFPLKASFFTPLSVCNADNGSLEFFPGTHQYGSLADAGEIDPSQFPAWPSVIPDLAPGDLVVMNSYTWHRSGIHSSGPDRIMADTILQPAYDPTTLKVLAGRERATNKMNREPGANYFVRSRVSRIKELVTELEGKNKSAAN